MSGIDAGSNLPRQRWRPDGALLLILLVALVARVVLAITQPLVHDEFNTSIPLAERISFDSAQPYLPLRAINHPALPAYVVKASTTLLDSKTPLGYRGLHVVASLVIVALMYSVTRRWFGRAAARWAAALVAFNEYSLAVSAHATAHVPFLLFVAGAVFAFSRFLADRRPGFLYLSGTSLALAFYAKEHAALLLPLFFLTLLTLPQCRTWLRRPHPYLAAVVFFAIVTPDVVWNMTRTAETQVTYSRHLQRIGGLGVSQYPTAFYLKSAVGAVQSAITGARFDDNTPEYRSMNVLLGALLLGSVVVSTVRRRDGVGRSYLLLLFWGVFGFFTLIRKGDPSGLDPVSWIWVDSTMLPAMALTGAVLADAQGKARLALWTFAVFGLIVAALRMFT